jgi:nucleotide-binding universal stress UspA family protein
MKSRLPNPPAQKLVRAMPGKPVEIAGTAAAIRGVQSILVPIDFSESSVQALAYAVAFAKAFDSEICLFSVVPDIRTSFEYGNSDYEKLIESGRRTCQAHLEEVLKRQVPADLRCRALTSVGKPYEAIVRFAQKQQVDLIIMATRGGRSERSELIGSTTERVVCYAPCPVLTVRFPERDFVDVVPSKRFQPVSRDAENATPVDNCSIGTTRKESV